MQINLIVWDWHKRQFHRIWLIFISLFRIAILFYDSLMRNENATIISCAHITLFIDDFSLRYLLGLNEEFIIKAYTEKSTTQVGCFEFRD